MNEKSLRVPSLDARCRLRHTRFDPGTKRTEDRGCFFVCTFWHLWSSFFMSLFLSCVFLCWFFCHFCDILFTHKKCSALDETLLRLIPTTRSKWATNSRRTRRECRCATPSSPLSVFFFCSRASESFTFFCKRDDAMSSSLAERSRYITIRKRLTQRDFCLLV